MSIRLQISGGEAEEVCRSPRTPKQGWFLLLVEGNEAAAGI